MRCFHVKLPAHLVNRGKGKTVALPVEGKDYPVKIDQHGKASLRTRDWREATARLAEAWAQFAAFRDAMQRGTQRLPPNDDPDDRPSGGMFRDSMTSSNPAQC